MRCSITAIKAMIDSGKLPQGYDELILSKQEVTDGFFDLDLKTEVMMGINRRNTDIPHTLKYMGYPALREKMLAFIGTLEDINQRQKAESVLHEFEAEESNPSCGPCGSKAAPKMRIWLTQNT